LTVGEYVGGIFSCCASMYKWQWRCASAEVYLDIVLQSQA